MSERMTSSTVNFKGREYLVQEWMGKISVSAKRKTGYYHLTSDRIPSGLLEEAKRVKSIKA